MGTLTAGQPRLAEYCEHKLPTSCRLTSIPQCCACADERAHSAEYRTYIDGVGFVLRGTRWQRYCWFCKEFWQQRVEASGLRPTQTRIPEVPDQAEFLARWYEFWQGYRVIGHEEDGTERRQAVVGEELKEVGPGCLPRTLEEMRAGRLRSEADRRASLSQVQQLTQNNEHTIDATLDALFEEAAQEEAGDHHARSVTPTGLAGLVPVPLPLAQRSMSNNVHAQAMVPAPSRGSDYRARRIAALRRELHRMRNGIERVISGLRDLGENVSDHTETTNQLTSLSATLRGATNTTSSQEHTDHTPPSAEAPAASTGPTQQDRTLATIQARVDEARQHFTEARRTRDQAANELELAEQEYRTSQQRLQQLQREQRTTENYMRVFGTRQEFLAAGDNYESPIGGLFTRAMERFRMAEEVRRETRTLRQVLEDEQAAGGEEQARRLLELSTRERDVWGVPVQRSEQNLTSSDPQLATDAIDTPDVFEEATHSEEALEEYYAMVRRQSWTQIPQSDQIIANPEQSASSVNHSPESLPVAEDAQETRTDRELAHALRMQQGRESALAARNDAIAALARGDLGSIGSAPPYIPPSQQYTRLGGTELDWWLEDAKLVTAFLEDANSPVGNSMRHATSEQWSIEEAHRVHWCLNAGVLTQLDRESIERELFRNEEVVFITGLPQERIRRAQAAGHEIAFKRPQWEEDLEGTYGVDPNRIWNIELMAQAYMKSAGVRRFADVSAMERLQMLYRFQAGQRQVQDREQMRKLLADTGAKLMAIQAIQELYGRQQPETQRVDTRLADEIARLQLERQDAARAGDHSREELDASRRAASAFAVAAGRQAMQTSPQTLLERMHANRTSFSFFNHDADERERITQASTLRNRIQNGEFFARLTRDTWATGNNGDHLSTSDSEGEDPDDHDNAAVGLDAKDTGRPEPKTDEEMTIKMDCKICYTQTAEIACLPCGHLVMCQWCSDQHSPTMQHDRTRPLRAAGCPVCRKGVRQKLRVFRA